VNVTGIFLDIVIVLLAAKVAAEIAERLGVPAIVGEIVAGISVGPSVLGILEPNKVLEVLGELGVVLLLLEVGLELSIGDLRAVGRSSLTIAVIGVVVPVSLGIATGLTFGESRSTALFLGLRSPPRASGSPRGYSVTSARSPGSKVVLSSGQPSLTTSSDWCCSPSSRASSRPERSI
jgi:Kef-type K+ transport system membrane component KefB